MQTKIVALACLCAFGALGLAQAEPTHLFTRIQYSGTDNSPPPPDALTVYDTALDVSGLAWMPDEVAVRIPRKGGDVAVTIRRERMDRREGFTERDP